MKIDVLDHGYVELIETWGSEKRIIEAARMSTGKGFLGWKDNLYCKVCEISVDADTCGYPFCPECGCDFEKRKGDQNLLSFLFNNNHSTPFEMAGAIIEVKAPIFVFREWHRHRTQSYNEMSARYIPIPDEHYIPSLDRLLQVNEQTSNKQAQGLQTLTEQSAVVFQRILAEQYEQANDEYQAALDNGVAKELARLMMPVGRYSKMRASANLRNWLQFLALRQPSNAQWEIRQYANAVCTIMEAKFPRTVALYKAREAK